MVPPTTRTGTQVEVSHWIEAINMYCGQHCQWKRIQGEVNDCSGRVSINVADVVKAYHSILQNSVLSPFTFVTPPSPHSLAPPPEASPAQLPSYPAARTISDTLPSGIIRLLYIRPYLHTSIHISPPSARTRRTPFPLLFPTLLSLSLHYSHLHSPFT